MSEYFVYQIPWYKRIYRREEECYSCRWDKKKQFVKVSVKDIEKDIEKLFQQRVENLQSKIYELERDIFAYQNKRDPEAERLEEKLREKIYQQDQMNGEFRRKIDDLESNYREKMHAIMDENLKLRQMLKFKDGEK